MPRSVPVTKTLGSAGLDLGAMTAPDALGDVVDPGTILVVRNAGGASITVTVQSAVTIDGLALPNRTRTVAAGAIGMIPIRAAAAARAVDAVPDPAKAYVDYSAVASVTRELIKAT